MDLGSVLLRFLDRLAQDPAGLIGALLAIALAIYGFLWSIRTVTAVGALKTLWIAVSGMIVAVVLSLSVLVFARFTTFYMVGEFRNLGESALSVVLDQSSTQAKAEAVDKDQSGSALGYLWQQILKEVNLQQIVKPSLPQAAPQPQPQPTPSGQSFAPNPQPSTGGRTYVVQPGDTMFHIAQTFGSTVDAIALKNGILNPSQIQVGMTLVIP